MNSNKFVAIVAVGSVVMISYHGKVTKLNFGDLFDQYTACLEKVNNLHQLIKLHEKTCSSRKSAFHKKAFKQMILFDNQVGLICQEIDLKFPESLNLNYPTNETLYVLIDSKLASIPLEYMFLDTRPSVRVVLEYRSEFQHAQDSTPMLKGLITVGEQAELD